MKVYNVEWPRFVDLFLPNALRQPTIKMWFSSLLKPLNLLHLDFLNFRAEVLYRANHNSQIVYMEAMLNDKFDPLGRGIYIANVVVNEPIWLREPEEQLDVFLYEPENNKPVYLPEPATLIGTGVDYSVCVPALVRPQTEAAELDMLTRMRGEIDYYNLYSKNYNILWV